MNAQWQKIWEGRRGEEVGRTGVLTLSDLVVADGFDSACGHISADAWEAFVTRIYADMRLLAGDSLFDVGCGSGAFLYPAYRSGVSVSGLDYSEALVELARRIMPEGDFDVCEATAIDTSDAVDVVLSCSVFMYFDSLQYARKVIEAMSTKARRAVAILDVPDAATARAALAHRQETLGGSRAYAERYEGLDHQAYDREWVVQILHESGLVDITVESQDILGYENGRFRFNAYGWVP
jgi:SAM-dependent methyltransferase